MAVKSVQKAITPNYARSVLAKGSPNRKLSEGKVMQYARDMLNNQWVLNHQGIAFDEDGNLIDGQHRLEAIVRSGCTVDMMVTTGLTKTATNGLVLHVMDTVDRGRIRSVGDQLYLRHGWQNANAVASYAKVCAEICTARPLGSLSTPQTLNVLKHFGNAINRTLEDCQNREDRIAAIAGTIAFTRHASPEIGEQFASDFFSGENLRKNHPVLALRKWLSNHRREFGAGGGRITVMRVMASAIQSASESGNLSKIYASEAAFKWLRNLYAKKLKDVTSHIEMPEPSVAV